MNIAQTTYYKDSPPEHTYICYHCGRVSPHDDFTNEYTVEIENEDGDRECIRFEGKDELCNDCLSDLMKLIRQYQSDLNNNTQLGVDIYSENEHKAGSYIHSPDMLIEKIYKFRDNNTKR